MIPDCFFIRIFLSSILLIQSGSCDEEGRVIKGAAVPEGKYPFMVSLLTKGFMGQTSHFCGGSIINGKFYPTFSSFQSPSRIISCLLSTRDNILRPPPPTHPKTRIQHLLNLCPQLPHSLRSRLLVSHLMSPLDTWHNNLMCLQLCIRHSGFRFHRWLLLKWIFLLSKILI